MTDCLPQEMYSVYVDGELSPEAARAVESHLVGCQSCRGLILAFREEATAIADVVLDRRRLRHVDGISRAPARTRARGLAIGLVPTLGVAALAVTTLGWLMETRLPTGVSWLNPMKLIGVYEMTFDMIFMLRDRAPALFEFTIALGAMLGAASILTFLVSAFARRVIGTFALLGFVGAALLVGPQAATALERRAGEGDMWVAVGETIEDSLLISGETVTIDGTIDGDLAAFGERVVLRGIVRGNVFTAGREVEILGTIEGSLFAAGERVTIEGEVQQGVYAGAESLRLHDRAQVGRDAVLFGESVHMDGRTARDFFSAAERVEIRGHVGRNVSTRSRRLTLHETASIAGNLHYEIGRQGPPEIAPGAQIGGEITSGDLMHRMGGPETRWLDGHFYMRAAVFLVSAFLVGMLLRLLLPGLFLTDLETASDFFRSLGYGTIGLIGTPIAIVLCFVSVVGIPIGVIGVFLYLTTLFVSVIVVASLVGTSITATMSFEPEDAHGFGVSLLVGLVLVLIGINLPFVGGIFRVLVVVIGLGMLIDVALDAWRRRGEESYAI